MRSAKSARVPIWGSSTSAQRKRGTSPCNSPIQAHASAPDAPAAPPMVTTQSAVTVMADILAGHEGPLRQLLEAAGQDAANNSLVPFGKLATVHFARFF